MNRLGIFLGFPPHGGGAFQYAHSTLLAAAALPAGDWEVVAAHAHPAWACYLKELSPRVATIPVRSGMDEAFFRTLLRVGFPAVTWRKIAANLHPLAKALLRQQCDFWLFPGQEYLAYAVPTRTIGVVHDLMHRYEPQFPEVSALGLYRRRENHYKNLCNFASAILVDSEVGRNHVLDAYEPSANKVYVLPYAAPDYPGHEQKQFDTLLPAKFIFYPAQFWKHKNHVRLLHALAEARIEIPDLHLVLSGSPKNAYKEVASAITHLGLRSHVHLLGYVPDAAMPELYRRAIALVMPTFFGPTNIPPLEAMALGCPVIVSRIYGMTAQLGAAAEYVDPGSVSSIAAAIIRLSRDEPRRNELIEAGFRRSAELSQQQFNHRFAQILQSLAHS